MQNDFATQHWLKVRDEHLSLRSHLGLLPDKLSQVVMVPIGSKALMRGKMVHTNEILVCLGDGWFVKRSAKEASEICDRRIKGRLNSRRGKYCFICLRVSHYNPLSPDLASNDFHLFPTFVS